MCTHTHQERKERERERGTTVACISVLTDWSLSIRVIPSLIVTLCHSCTTTGGLSTLPPRVINTVQAYRFTDVSELASRVPCLPTGDRSRVAEAALRDARGHDEETSSSSSENIVITIVDGVFDAALSNLTAAREGISVRSTRDKRSSATAAASASCGDLQASVKSHSVFASLNGACARDAILIDIAEGANVEDCVQLVYVSTGEDGTGAAESLPSTFPRVLVTAGANSSCNILETFVSAPSEEGRPCAHLTCPVLEIALERGAEVRHDCLQQTSKDAFCIRQTCVKQAESSTYSFTGVDMGSKLARHDLNVMQDGPDTETKLYSFAMVGKNQLVDLHSDVDLNHPRGATDQLHKCIVSHPSSRGVFDGSVHVRKPAQLTDAGQMCRSLLLDRNATVNVKPNLRIHADDVKCTHGATISDLEEDELFYLRSRGISYEEARKTLVFSFGFDIVGRLRSERTRKRIAAALALMVQTFDV